MGTASKSVSGAYSHKLAVQLTLITTRLLSVSVSEDSEERIAVWGVELRVSTRIHTARSEGEAQDVTHSPAFVEPDDVAIEGTT